MREEELLRVKEVLDQQTALIRRLRSELRMARGEIAEGGDPIEQLLALALAGEPRVRVEAASLVLQHAAAEGQIAQATAVLTEVARHPDTPGDLKIDALRALARRAVPKAPPAAATVTIDIAARLKEARLRAAERPPLLTYNPGA